MESNILSISIPTYNRADALQQTLEKIIAFSQGRIGVYICDNHSSDDTEEVCKSFVDKYDYIHYHRHEKNIGPDDNFEFALKYPDTKYRWLMSDTCFPEVEDTLLDDLGKNDFDAYIINGDAVRAGELPDVKTVYNNAIDIMNSVGWHCTWICAMIYSKDLIMSFDFGRYKYSSFNQTAILFEGLAGKACNVCFNPRVSVANIRYVKNSGWESHVFEVFYRQLYCMLMSLPIYYPFETKLQCIRDHTRKASVLRIKDHYYRRLRGKWKLKDLLDNAFFVKQAQENYSRLFIYGLIPLWLLRATRFNLHLRHRLKALTTQKS